MNLMEDGMIRGDGLSRVTVNRERLLATLKENRGKHAAAVEEAVGDYRKAAEKELVQKLEDLRLGKKISHHLHLSEPRGYVADYDRVISMLEWTSKTEVEVTESEFTRYVLDDWEWKAEFTAIASSYKR